jgi:hypothetical protein
MEPELPLAFGRATEEAGASKKPKKAVTVRRSGLFSGIQYHRAEYL